MNDQEACSGQAKTEELCPTSDRLQGTRSGLSSAWDIMQALKAMSCGKQA